MLNSDSSHEWHRLYEAALLEADSSKLPERIIKARNAIFNRIEESMMDPLPGEQAAMDCALRALGRLAESVSPLRNAA